jgi:hypothetical protein
MIRQDSRFRRVHVDAETGVYRRREKSLSQTYFPPALSDSEILDIVDDLTESLLDW